MMHMWMIMKKVKSLTSEAMPREEGVLETLKKTGIIKTPRMTF